MKDQHKKITGYRDLSLDEIELMNEVKAIESDVLKLVDRTNELNDSNKRSLAIAKNNLQTGFMWLVRAIARPNGE